MASRLSGTQNPGRHDWNTFENYGHINERRLDEHPFVESSEVTFSEIEAEGDLFIVMDATVHCRKNVVLEVTKYFETMRRGRGEGRLYVRTQSYRYNACFRGKHNILRYDNAHELDEYHGHWFDLETGHPIDWRAMSREEFPLFSEVLDELQEMVGS